MTAVALDTWRAVHHGAVAAPAAAVVMGLTGPGAVSCVQGLLTNDIEKPGDGAFVYGAMLTPKGMIVVDGWAARHGTTVTYTIPAAAGPQVRALLARSVPPRLARISDFTGQRAVVRLLGPLAVALADTADLAAMTGCTIERPAGSAPFAIEATVPEADVEELLRRCRSAGFVQGDDTALECARILGGWPQLGAEIDDKTIPQEVRFDELGGVSYTKGCYTGQETVSRLHFRGHVNRSIRGLLFDGEPRDADGVVLRQDHEVGRVTSLLRVPDETDPLRSRWIGLAMVRREVVPGGMVRAAGCDARVVELPFSL